MIKVFIGFDARETVAFHALTQSIIQRASAPVSISPIVLSHLKDVYTRPRHPLQSTDFSFSRFLVPYLANYEGWALFMDCDMLFTDDIFKLWSLRDEKFAVQVVKHDYVPHDSVKFLGATQVAFQRKNWSSMMLFNCSRCRALTPDYVNQASGLELHQFKWLPDDDLIGSLDGRWNHLVGEYPHKEDVGLLHYTVGGPYFTEFASCDYSKEWFESYKDMIRCDQRS